MKTTVEIRTEQQLVLKERQAVEEEIARLTEGLASAKDRLLSLKRKTIDLESSLQLAHLVENQRQLPKAAWITSPRWTDGAYVIIKVTAKQIKIQKIGSSATTIYSRGTGKSAWEKEGQLDVPATVSAWEAWQPDTINRYLPHPLPWQRVDPP